MQPQILIVFCTFWNKKIKCPLPCTQGSNKYTHNHGRKYKVEEYLDEKENLEFLVRVQIDQQLDEILWFVLIPSSKHKDFLLFCAQLEKLIQIYPNLVSSQCENHLILD